MIELYKINRNATTDESRCYLARFFYSLFREWLFLIGEAEQIVCRHII